MPKFSREQILEKFTRLGLVPAYPAGATLEQLRELDVREPRQGYIQFIFEYLTSAQNNPVAQRLQLHSDWSPKAMMARWDAEPGRKQHDLYDRALAGPSYCWIDGFLVAAPNASQTPIALLTPLVPWPDDIASHVPTAPQPAPIASQPLPSESLKLPEPQLTPEQVAEYKEMKAAQKAEERRTAARERQRRLRARRAEEAKEAAEQSRQKRLVEEQDRRKAFAEEFAGNPDAGTEENRESRHVIPTGEPKPWQ